MGVFSSLFGGASRKNRIIDAAIKKLAENGSLIGTAFKEIDYDDVIFYIENKRCSILNIIKKDRGDWIEFVADVQGEKYTVCLNKTFEGNGAVLTARRENF